MEIVEFGFSEEIQDLNLENDKKNFKEIHQSLFPFSLSHHIALLHPLLGKVSLHSAISAKLQSFLINFVYPCLAKLHHLQNRIKEVFHVNEWVQLAEQTYRSFTNHPYIKKLLELDLVTVTYVYPNGSQYIGQSRRGLFHGKGIFTTANGDRYEGEWKNNQKHGHGILVLADTSRYEGEWAHDQMHGKGIFVFADNTRYEGEWAHHHIHGQGIFINVDGSRYEGQFKNGTIHGPGVFTFPDGACYKGQWENNLIVFPSTQLAWDAFRSPLFISSLLGIDNTPSYLCQYPLAILAPILDDPMLQNAHHLGTLEYPDAAKEIMQTLTIDGQEILYPYITSSSNGSGAHAIGIAMKKEGDWISIRILNSGDGLWYHQNKGKYFATQWEVQIPSIHISETSLLHLLQQQYLQPIQDLYEMLLNLPETKQIVRNYPVWQTPQKASNCSVEWIFAYLKNSMPEKEYHKLRLKLFEDCLQNVQQWETPDPSIIAILEAKIAKRKKKLSFWNILDLFRNLLCLG